ncbi:TonB-dependent receptor domain-containing protein [Hymenobacter properus]|uniref:TonB-dependent receptor n=1 Tax=Hymenobacter properus TaxID=2791026 RepID=A0A931BFD5_9BACT|nr:TonB-dependent receptor [Hymenobacter properus]MBF9140666.1 TonB-dependent receptor [Hymenobacter properus]MBR7719474.1 TonB-dependent receptor [Microvirga sp. SRT04]
MKTFLFSASPLLVASLLAGAHQAHAQAPTDVRGTVQSTGNSPIEFATVTLHRAKDSTVVKTEFSDAKGLFQFERAAAGRYLVSAAQVGFERRWSTPFEVAGQAVELPAMVLATSAATQLKEVKVVGQKPLYEREADRTIVNVEGSTLAAGNTSLDVLRRSPGVTVDGNDNLALRGRQGVLVLIDGKRQPMTGTELAEYLRALPAEQLKSIELITNPPAKYDAQGGAGIIAINLKKDQKLGTNGSLNLTYGRGEYNRYTGGLSLNHREKNLNLFGSYNYSDRSFYNTLTLHREFYGPATGGSRQLISTSDQDNRQPVQAWSHSWRGGLDYNLSDKTTIGAVVSGLNNRNTPAGTSQSVVYDLQRNQELRYNAINTGENHLDNFAANLNFRRTFANAFGTQELTADADYASYHSQRDQLLQTYFVSEPALANSLDQDGRLTIQSVKADYTQALSKQLRLDMGAKSSLVKADNDLKNFTNGQLDLTRSNRFRYDENINAGYVNLNYSQPKLTLQVGLRGEQTNATGLQDREVEYKDFKRNYFQLFPSAAIKRQFSENHELAVSLSRRIDRPGYQQLNPFRQLIDRTTSQGGNPNLLPQTSYNVELTHTFKQKYSLGLSYSRTSAPIVGTVEPEPGSTVISTYRNLDLQHYYALTLTTPVDITKWWKTYNNAVFYYNRFNGAVAGTNLDRGGVSLNLTSNHTFTFGKGWGAELSASYDSRQVDGFFVSRPNGEVGAGVQKSLWERKATLKLAVNDIFFSRVGRVTSTYDNYVERFVMRRDSRFVNLTFGYRFGNDKLAPTRRRSGGAEDEKRRAG